MKRGQQIWLLALLFMPFPAFAHGEDILAPFFIQLISLLLFIAFIASVKIKARGKLLLTVIYLVTAFGVFALFANLNYGEYLRNKETINSVIAIVPPFVVMLVFFILDKRYAKHRL